MGHDMGMGIILYCISMGIVLILKCGTHVSTVGLS